MTEVEWVRRPRFTTVSWSRSVVDALAISGPILVFLSPLPSPIFHNVIKLPKGFILCALRSLVILVKVNPGLATSSRASISPSSFLAELPRSLVSLLTSNCPKSNGDRLVGIFGVEPKVEFANSVVNSFINVTIVHLVQLLETLSGSLTSRVASVYS